MHVYKKNARISQKCLRKILKINWTDKISNENVWTQTKQKLIEEGVGERRWRWLGHTLRKPGDNISRKALGWNPQGKRSRGRPRITWKRVLVRDKQVDRHGALLRDWPRIESDGRRLLIAYI